MLQVGVEYLLNQPFLRKKMGQSRKRKYGMEIKKLIIQLVHKAMIIMLKNSLKTVVYVCAQSLSHV